MIDNNMDELNEDLKALTDDQEAGDYDEELGTAANFLFRYGPLGSYLEEPDLSRVQFWPVAGTALYLIGHHSVTRNDPRGPGRDFPNHQESCQPCAALETTLAFRQEFEEELCAMCGGDVDAHGIKITDESLVKLVCVGQWQRNEPDVTDVGNVSFDTQIGPSAYRAAWSAPLADGSFAVVTRTYWVGKNDRRDGIVLYRDDDYIVCTDPADPAGTKVFETWNLEEVESDDPQAEDLVELAQESFPPEPGEWQDGWDDYSYDIPVFAVPVHT
jgi:hypothetical protein